MVGQGGNGEPEVARQALQAALEAAVATSFNRITVDGDMSTNDTVLVLANGLAANPILRETDLRRARSSARKAKAPSAPL
ncbi:MAG: bifunctional ornithine acetyltransferase/N-acetylglutamate synthase, partial [Armatimonadota bacterium]